MQQADLEALRRNTVIRKLRSFSVHLYVPGSKRSQDRLINKLIRFFSSGLFLKEAEVRKVKEYQSYQFQEQECMDVSYINMITY